MYKQLTILAFACTLAVGCRDNSTTTTNNVNLIQAPFFISHQGFDVAGSSTNCSYLHYQADASISGG